MTTHPHTAQDIRPTVGQDTYPGRQHTATRAFGIAFAGALCVALLLQGTKPFYYDSGYYWTLGGTFFKDGHFSLLNFDSPLRGYLLPLINHALHRTAVVLKWRDSSLAKLFNAFLFSLIGAVLAPRLAQLTWKQQRWSVRRRLALTVLLLVFWSGYLNFPLSDFPALTMALLAILAASRPYAPGSMLLAGIATAAAIDMRPSYLPLAPIVLVLAAWSWIEGRESERRTILRLALCLTLLLAGFVSVSVPQSLSSHRHFHTWSFIPGSAAHLESLQLTEGLTLQRYETYIGPPGEAAMDYQDDTGSRLLYKQPRETITGAGQYLGLIVDYPLTMGGVFARHLINGLDQRYSTPYTERVPTD